MATKKILKKKVKKKTTLKDAPKLLSIETSKDELLGKYSNAAIIRHTSREFIMDFLFTLDEHSILSSRLITSPQHAKRIYEALGSNIKLFEKTHGKIPKD